jgi:hypothetical protein
MPSDTIPIYTMTEETERGQSLGAVTDERPADCTLALGNVSVAPRIPDDELDHLEWMAGSKAAIVTMSKETLRELLRAYRAQEIRVIGSLEGITSGR